MLILPLADWPPNLGAMVMSNRAADLLLAEAQGYGANDFKIPLARRTLVSVLNELTEEAQQ